MNAGFPPRPGPKRRARTPWFLCFCSYSRFAYCFRVSRCSCATRARSVICRARLAADTALPPVLLAFSALAGHKLLPCSDYGCAKPKASLRVGWQRFLTQSRDRGELAAGKTLARSTLRRKASSRFFFSLAYACRGVESRPITPAKICGAARLKQVLSGENRTATKTPRRFTPSTCRLKGLDAWRNRNGAPQTTSARFSLSRQRPA